MATPNQAPRSRGRQPDPNSVSGKIRGLLETTDLSVPEIAKKLGCKPALVYNVKARLMSGGQQRRGPGRPPKASAPARAGYVPGNSGLDGILAVVQNNERERSKLRDALRKIQMILQSALG